MKTYQPKKKEVKREWHLVDAKDQVLGRLATKVATLLVGKGKPYFTRHLDCGDFVLVKNAAQVATTGKKETTKKYTRFSGYPGGLKTTTLKKMRAEKPEEVVRLAIIGMLPDNKLKKFWITRLTVNA